MAVLAFFLAKMVAKTPMKRVSVFEMGQMVRLANHNGDTKKGNYAIPLHLIQVAKNVLIHTLRNPVPPYVS